MTQEKAEIKSREKSRYCERKISFPDEFADDLELFEELIKIDTSLVPNETQMKNGMFSLGIRAAISYYIRGDPQLGIPGRLAGLGITGEEDQPSDPAEEGQEDSQEPERETS